MATLTHWNAFQIIKKFWNNWRISIVFYHRKWNKWMTLKCKLCAESSIFISLFHVRGHVIHLQCCKSFWVMDRDFCLRNNSSLTDLIANERQWMEMVARTKSTNRFISICGLLFLNIKYMCSWYCTVAHVKIVCEFQALTMSG